jgi:hypothetical protein
VLVLPFLTAFASFGEQLSNLVTNGSLTPDTVFGAVADLEGDWFFSELALPHAALYGDSSSFTMAWVIAVALSVATNIMATALILVPLARYWWATLKVLPDRKAPGLYSHVASIIIESAAPLTLWGICLLVSHTASKAVSQPLVGTLQKKDILTEHLKRWWRYQVLKVMWDLFSLLYFSFSVCLAPI